MTNQRKHSLFYKYFLSFASIFIIIAVLIMAIATYIILSNNNSVLKIYRTKTEGYINQIMQDLTNDCVNAFANIQITPSLPTLIKQDVGGMTDLQICNMYKPINTQLSVITTLNNYIDSVYIVSMQRNKVLSNTGIRITNDFSSYSWYDSQFDIRAAESDFWVSKTEPATITIYRKTPIEQETDVISVIVLKANKLINDINLITDDVNLSYVLFDYAENVPLLSFNVNSDTENFNAWDRTKTSALFPKYSFSSYDIPEYSWKCLYKYDNNAATKTVFYKMSIYLPLAFIILIICAILLTFFYTSKIHKPINETVTLLNQINQSHMTEDYDFQCDYVEIKYIVQTILESFKNKNDLEQRLTESISQLNNTKNRVLQAQIRPHFIFNTLNIIYLECYNALGEESDITQMIYNLADIIRISFCEDKSLPSIRDELLYSKKYIEIQTIRFADEFQVEWEIDPTLENYLTPKLILQPVIENAIMHGLIPSDKCGTLTIQLTEDGGDIIFIIQDTGVGMSEEQINTLNALLSSDDIPHEHIGLVNVNLRIKLLFGSKYGCKIIQSGSGGTIINIRIPKIPNSEEQE